VDRLRKLRHLSRGGHIVPTLGVDLSDVGVGSGFDHDDIIGTGCAPLGVLVDSLGIEQQGSDLIHGLIAEVQDRWDLISDVPQIEDLAFHVLNLVPHNRVVSN